jgi:hypothetical protein
MSKTGGFAKKSGPQPQKSVQNLVGTGKMVGKKIKPYKA